MKEVEPFIRNGEHIQTGKPFEKFGGMRSRELLANWLLCVVVNFARGTDDLTFTTDPSGGDGLLYDRKAERGWPTEHVIVPRDRGQETESLQDRILKAISQKQDKGGAAYAAGKVLVVLSNAGERAEWSPNRVAKQLPLNFDFDDVWVVCLQYVEEGEYVYGVTQLDMSEGNAPTFSVRISKDFSGWTVTRLQ